MNKQQYEVNNLPTQIVIGHQTETGVTSIYFDCTSWLASWPDLVLGVWVTQPGGTAAYPAATHMEEDVLVWDVTDSDTAVPGTGTMEIVGIASGKKKLSAITKTLIQRTTTGTATEPPEGAKAWVDSVMQAANDAETSKSQAATYAQNAAASAEKAEENSKSVTWETLSGKPSTFPPDSHTHTLESLGAASAESVNQLKSDLRVNLIRPTMQTMEMNGVTCTNNGDGTYTLNGTASGTTNFYILDQVKDLGGKRIVGCPSGGGYNSYRLYAIRTDTFVDSINEFGNGVNVSTEFSKDIAWQIRIRIQDGVTVNNLVFKPMITTDLTATYNDFVSYDDSLVKGCDVIDKASIGDAWTSGKTYAVGDYCIIGNQLYKCKTAHTAGSAFNADYWDAVSVAGEILTIGRKLYVITKYTDANTDVSITLKSTLAKRTVFFYGTANNFPCYGVIYANYSGGEEHGYGMMKYFNHTSGTESSKVLDCTVSGNTFTINNVSAYGIYSFISVFEIE